eukprot:14690049-Alexandrium_andersonii.AAC.1
MCPGAPHAPSQECAVEKLLLHAHAQSVIVLASGSRASVGSGPYDVAATLRARRELAHPEVEMSR